MLRNRTKLEKRFIAVSPLSELRLHGIRDMREFRKVPVVDAQAADEFPDSLDGIKEPSENKHYNLAVLLGQIV